MEILGIGPGEFVLILIILLVVVGPERLPDLARQAGRLLVRGRNWLQSSPDAAMVMRARQEIEQELANLKTSLLEVQSVRDEVLDAAKQIGDSVGSLTSAAKAELEDIGSIASLKPANPLQDLEATLAKAHGQPSADAPSPADRTIARGADLAPEADLAQDMVDAPDATAALDVPPAPDALDALDAPELAPRVALRQPRQPSSYAEDLPAPAAPDAGVLETIDLRLQAIMADLFALQQQLKQRGVLDDTWQPPSWDIQLPAEQPTNHAAPPAPAEQTAPYSAPTLPAEPVATEEAPNV